jgi:hypothetical protein
VAEDGKGPDSGPVFLLRAFVEDSGEELVIGLHGGVMAAEAGVSKPDISVIPAKAGTSGHEVSAGLPEVPAFAGMTIC